MPQVYLCLDLPCSHSSFLVVTVLHLHVLLLAFRLSKNFIYINSRLLFYSCFRAHFWVSARHIYIGVQCVPIKTTVCLQQGDKPENTDWTYPKEEPWKQDSSGDLFFWDAIGVVSTVYFAFSLFVSLHNVLPSAGAFITFVQALLVVTMVFFGVCLQFFPDLHHPFALVYVNS